MLIHLTPIKDKPGSSLHIKKELPPPDLSEISSVNKVLSPLQVDLTVTNTGKAILVEGFLQLKVSLTCTRCLTGFTQTLSTEFSDEFVSGEALGVDDGEALLSDETPTFQGDELDISDLLLESVILALPMKVVCRDDCQGLCPACGQVLNEGACDCKVEDVDPRLAPLADLFKK